MLEIERPYLHPKQEEIYNSDARFKVVNAGRRGGKTLLCTLLALDDVMAGGHTWWIAPTYAITKIGWRALKTLFEPIPDTEVREGDRSITYLPTGGMVEMKSADDPTKLRGEGLTKAIFDEFAFMERPSEAWEQSIRPALSDRRGGAIFISTPNGLNYFYQLAQKAKRTKDWAYFHFPTSANPFIPAEEIEEARATLPDEVFRQEYEAEFLDSGSLVFADFTRLIREDIWEDGADEDSRYRIGVDWGKKKDFTVITVFNITKRTICYIERFNQIDYSVQLGTLERVIDKFNPETVVVESNSMGEVLVELLKQGYGTRIKPYKMLLENKRDLVEGLMLGFAQERLYIPDHTQLIAELRAFQVGRTQGGRITYGHPEGQHDDMVISLALAYTGGNKFFKPNIGTVVENIFY